MKGRRMRSSRSPDIARPVSHVLAQEGQTPHERLSVRPEGNRAAFAEDAGTAVLAVGSTVGKAYEPPGWDVWAQFHPVYEAGDYDAVVDPTRP